MKWLAKGVTMSINNIHIFNRKPSSRLRFSILLVIIFVLFVTLIPTIYITPASANGLQVFLGWWGKGTSTTGWHSPGSGETGVLGNGDGQFDYTEEIGVDSSGNVYVSDVGNHRLQKFTGSGALLGWLGRGTSTTGWHAPGSGETGVSGNGDGQFSGPSGVVVDSSGNVYVADFENNRIQKFSNSGVFLGWWGKGTSTTGWHIPGSGETGVSGNGDAQFDIATGVAIDSSENIYVADYNNGRIQKFTNTGVFLGWWGKGTATTGWHVPGSGETAGTGGNDGQFNKPISVAIDSSDNLYVADSANKRIQKFNGSGLFLGWWGKGTATTGWHLPGSGETGVAGTGDGQFVSPEGVAIDTSGNVIVVDPGNHRLQKFTGSGALLGWLGRGTSTTGWHLPGSGETGMAGTGDGQFNSPEAVIVDASGNIFVSDSENNRIQKYGYPTGNLEILKFQDMNNNGAREANSEPVLANWGFNITGPNNYSASGVTDSSGLLTLSGLVTGTYTVSEKGRAPDNPGGAWYCTTGDFRTVTVPAGGTVKVEFGNNYNPKVPASSNIGLYGMIGIFALLIGVLVYWRGRRGSFQKR